MPIKHWFTGIPYVAWLLRFHWSYVCKYFLLIFSVNFKVTFTKVVYVYLCFIG